jgi:sugar lactone lactonase YvrE
MPIYRALFVFCLLALTVACDAQPTVKADWQLSQGLAQPESVVFDARTQHLFVSNVNGNPNDVDGNGYISKLSADGQMIDAEWVSGLNAPKGLAISGTTLYVADINQLIAIDINSGEIIQRYHARNAKFLNDVAVTLSGDVYVSDMVTNEIYQLSQNNFSLWLQDDKLISPNGLLVEGDQLIVASWGKMTDGFATEVPGHLLTIDLNSKQIHTLGNGTPVGNLDGIEPAQSNSYYVTDWMAGKLLLIHADGHAQTLLDLNPGSADLTVIPSQHRLIIPMMQDSELHSYLIQ